LTGTDFYAVIGDPIGHSLSPAMQCAAFKDAGIPARYDAVLVPQDRLERWVAESPALPYRGFNVTIPHKERVAALVDRLDGTAEAVGAVNTVLNCGGALHGFNTDVPGFAATVRWLGIDVYGLPVVVFGAGGSARAVVYALIEAGAEVTIVNRNLARAREVAAIVRRPVAIHSAGSIEAARAIPRAALIVNTTPLGMAHLPVSPLPEGPALTPTTAVIDLVYGRTTPLLETARAAGCLAVDGIEILVQQGAASFRLWTDTEPDLDVMRDACRRYLMEVQACSAS
jgi:shikimate dehydrogenase